MAVTQGHGNPDWVRDEILLALDLYLRCDGNLPGPTDSRVVALSNEIRQLPLHAGAAKRESFRNAAGVHFKLQNLRQVATGHGLEHSSRADRDVWQSFGRRPDLVRTLVDEIRRQVTTAEVSRSQVASIDDDEVFGEGRVLTALHRSRERSPKVRARLIHMRRASGQLFCEACGEGPKVEVVRELEDAGFEVHHIVPLSTVGQRGTRLRDLALLCATCHRLIHRAMHVRGSWITVQEFQGLVSKHNMPAATPLVT